MALSVTLQLDDRHAAVLEELAAKQDMSKASLLRQALRLYQMVYLREMAGEKLAFSRDGKTVIPVVIVGLPAFD